MRRASRVVSAGLKPQTPQMPKTPPSHGLTGLGAIKAGARKSALKSALRRAVAVAAFGLPRCQAKAGLHGQAGQAAASQQQRPASARCAALDFAPAALFSGANSRPPKRLYRTV